MDIQETNIINEIDQTTEAQVFAGAQRIELPATVVGKLEEIGFESSEVARIVGAREEILKLAEANVALPPELVDRVVRLARVMGLAERVFGKMEKAFLWMRLPNESLGRTVPIKMLESETGARIVEDALMRIEHGVYV